MPGIRENVAKTIAQNAEKISVNSLAVKNPQIISEGAEAFGRQCIVLGMDPVRSGKCPSGYEITIRGFREFTGMDAVEWAKRAVDLGVGEIVVNSVDADGTRAGFELEITRLIADAVNVPVVASGGAGTMEHFAEAAEAGATVLLGASVFHFNLIAIPDLKRFLKDRGFAVRI